MTITDIDFPGALAQRQLEIPGCDGYTAERLAVTISGGVEFSDLTQAEDVAFVKSLKLGQRVKLTVEATVVKNGNSLGLAKDDLSDDKLTYGVGLKVHSVEVA